MSQKNHLHWLFNHQKVLVDSRSILTVQSRNLFQIVHWVTPRKPLVTGFHTYLHRSPAVDRGMWLRGMYSLQVPFAAFLLPFCGQTNFECLYYIPLLWLSFLTWKVGLNTTDSTGPWQGPIRAMCIKHSAVLEWRMINVWGCWYSHFKPGRGPWEAATPSTPSLWSIRMHIL